VHLTLQAIGRTVLSSVSQATPGPVLHSEWFFDLAFGRHVRELFDDDPRLERILNTLSISDLQDACRERGMTYHATIMLSESELRQYLALWLELSAFVRNAAAPGRRTLHFRDSAAFLLHLPVLLNVNTTKYYKEGKK